MVHDEAHIWWPHWNTLLTQPTPKIRQAQNTVTRTRLHICGRIETQYANSQQPNTSGTLRRSITWRLRVRKLRRLIMSNTRPGVPDTTCNVPDKKHSSRKSTQKSPRIGAGQESARIVRSYVPSKKTVAENRSPRQKSSRIGAGQENARVVRSMFRSNKL